MLRLLHYHISLPATLPPFPAALWGSPPPALSAGDRVRLPPAVNSILYSDVGPKFYERATIGPDRPGWIVRGEQDCQEIRWNLSAHPPSGTTYDWIYARDLPAVTKQLSDATRARLAHDYRDAQAPIWCTDPASPGTLSYVPFSFMPKRAEDRETNLQIVPCGVRLPASEEGQEESVVIFTLSTEGGPLGQALVVNYTHQLDTARLPLLLGALDEIGAEYGLKDALVWGVDPKSSLGEAWMGQEGRQVQAAQRPDIKGHLLGIAWYGGAEAVGEVLDTGCQVWAWC
jgi:hypothetical protein